MLAGERELYALLVLRYQDSLYRYALGMVRHPDAAADLVQDCFVRGFGKLPGCSAPDRFRAWIFRILRNGCLDYLKSPRRAAVPLDQGAEGVPSRDDPEAQLARAEARGGVAAALAALPEAQREAFLLKHLDECSYEEMSEMLGASVSALKMRVMRAREALQALLQAHRFPDPASRAFRVD